MPTNSYGSLFLSCAIILTIISRFSSIRYELDLSDETIRIQNFQFNRKLWWKNCWKCPRLLRYQKKHSFQTIKDINPKFWLHITEDLNVDFIQISRLEIINIWIRVSKYYHRIIRLSKKYIEVIYTHRIYFWIYTLKLKHIWVTIITLFRIIWHQPEFIRV